MDNVDFDKLLVNIFDTHFTGYIPYGVIDKSLRVLKMRKNTNPKDVKEVFFELGFGEWAKRGGCKCMKWTTEGIEYVKGLKANDNNESNTTNC